MSTDPNSPPPDAPDELDSGNYEVLRGRLEALGRELAGKAEALNDARKDVFGSTELAVTGNARVRTEHNCVPRDIVNAGGLLLFGYNVFIGLKTETAISDVFALHRFAAGEGGFELTQVPIEELPGFVGGSFRRDFDELYQYYKDARLVQLRHKAAKLLAVFQTGASATDSRVFRWALDSQLVPTYLDNRGERDHTFPPSHDFTWTATTREDHVRGRHPHVSVLNEVFVECVGGDLTIKVEDNTEDGRGIYREPVRDANQALDDAVIEHAKVGTLILLKVRPFREEEYRYFVFNTRTKGVARIDAIGLACVQLPEDHGVMFPGGYYLQSGDHKVFDDDVSDLAFERSIRSPNGEDVLYVFHHHVEGSYVLFPYNLIRKEVQNPIHCHGWTVFEDGTMVVFRALSDEPTRVHPMQIWRTPFTSDEYAAQAPTDDSFLGKVGNADLVRGVSDALGVERLIQNQEPTRRIYEDLIGAATRVIDSYYWLGDEAVGDVHTTVAAIRDNAELIVDEFEKVLALRKAAADALAEAEQQKLVLERDLSPEHWDEVEQFMRALTSIRSQRGHLITLKERRYIDLERIEELEGELVDHFERVSKGAIEFLLRDEALAPIVTRLDGLLEEIEAVKKTPDLEPLREQVEETAEGLNVLTEVVGGLEVEDPTQRTEVLEGISEVFSHLNRVRATLQNESKELLSAEGRAEFAAQFRLFSQAVTSALALADTPERTDEQLSRLMVQLEELESRFSEFDEFLADLAEKREEVYEAFDARRQTLVDERQRRAQNLLKAAERILAGVTRRAAGFASADELNAYFAADPMVLKLRQISEQLGDLGDSVKADEVQSKLKSARQDAMRGLRDRLDLFEEGADVVKLGRHRFNVNTRPIELTLVPAEEGMALHVTGTDYHELVEDEAFRATKDFWSQRLVSETEDVYRSEYLAYVILADAEAGREGLSLEGLQEEALGEEGLLGVCRRYAQERYDEGYERGLHDADAARILEALLSLRTTAGLLRYAPTPRALACLWWREPAPAEEEAARAAWRRRAASLGRLRRSLGPTTAQAELADELGRAVGGWLEARGVAHRPGDAALAGAYLAEELAQDPPRFVTSQAATGLVEAFRAHLEQTDQRTDLEGDLTALASAERFRLARAWLEAYLAGQKPGEESGPGQPDRRRVLDEAAVLLLDDVGEGGLDREVSAARTATVVEGLLGQHPRIAERKLELRLDELLGRLKAFAEERVPAYRDYRRQVRELLERERRRLRLEELEPKVLTSFVRNRLIDEVYLPLVGDNLAKQLGAAGDSKRTDLMGLLLLVSPPGYGKTTLMEYVASRLGLAFVKVNGPSLGHSVTSLDPGEAPSATARQEVEKANLALEMGNNVMLYVDDIQHTHPEFLQKFISLCDAQRRIEGVWKGRTRTYDLRGKKFCVVMAGNPYTEAGEKFQIPDMLANRADTYNLGDILEGKGEQFALSYIENTLTSNATLQPLAARDQDDVYRLIRLARGEEVPTSEFAHSYSAVELGEITGVLKRLFQVRDVLLKVNALYIESASMDDDYRTEPRFQLQGSYRNMNKVAEKVAAAMNEAELEALIDDHYQSEAQTLTSGAEHNLLKLAELRGAQTEAQAARWEEIKRSFRRIQLTGGSDDDPVGRVTGQLSGLNEHVAALREAVAAAAAGAGGRERDDAASDRLLERLDRALETFGRPQLEVQVKQEDRAHDPDAAARRQAEALEQALRPVFEGVARNVEEGQQVAVRLARLLEDHLEYERSRRVRLRSPSGRLIGKKDDDDDDDPEVVDEDDDAATSPQRSASRPSLRPPPGT